MAFSWITKASPVFVGLGGAGIAPLVMASPLPPPPPYVPPKGYRLCDRLHPSSLALFVCSKKDESIRPSFFRKKEIKVTKDQKISKEDQWNKMTEMSYSVLPSRNVTMKFIDGTSISAKIALPWMRVNWTLKPEEHCTLTDSTHNGWYYVYHKLICKQPPISGERTGTLTQRVNL